ncbi:hypothetical protein [Corticicoccus populi]|uniref:YtkA-like domain-containing protein n=1 Tax=Corticicoccus populi TaxID=1812821 RepID=A0ABW5WVU5_9STAP
MKRILLIILAFSMLSACSILSDETHDIYNDIPDFDIAVDLSQIKSSEEISPVNLYINADDAPITDAEVSFTIWWSRESEQFGTDYTAEYDEAGYYTADIEIPHDGLFYIQASINHDQITADPVRYFTVGNTDMLEHMILEELIGDDEELEIEGHH